MFWEKLPAGILFAIGAFFLVVSLALFLRNTKLAKKLGITIEDEKENRELGQAAVLVLFLCGIFFSLTRVVVTRNGLYGALAVILFVVMILLGGVFTALNKRFEAKLPKQEESEKASEQKEEEL